MKVTSRNVVLASTVVGLLVAGYAIVRLATLVSATPTEAWLVEHPRLVNQSFTDSVPAQLHAWFTALVDDSMLLEVRLRSCRSAAEGLSIRQMKETSRTELCTDAIEDALKSAPWSGELWLHKLEMELRSGGPMSTIIDAFRRMYSTSRREGWLASRRVVPGLILFPLLPPDVRFQVTSDLKWILENPDFAGPLIEGYGGNLSVRRNSDVVVRDLSASHFDRFVEITVSGRAEINAFRYSEQLDRDFWLRGQISVVADAQVAPDGTMSAEKVVEDSTDDFHYLGAASGIAITANDIWTFSCFVKAAERTGVGLDIDGSNANGVYVLVDLSDGSVAAADSFGTATYVGSSVVALEEGWFRISVTGHLGPDDTTMHPTVSIRNPANIADATYRGDGHSGLFLWGAQMQKRDSPTAYTSTHDLTVDRPAGTPLRTP